MNTLTRIATAIVDRPWSLDFGKESQRWFCPPCGLVYDPEYGDPEGDILPGTSFDDLPHSWECPECGARKCDLAPLSD